MIVVRVARPNSSLPYDQKANRVIESKIRDLGEASDLEPGQKKTLRLVLKPGDYLLVCNQPGHYKSGMKTKSPCCASGDVACRSVNLGGLETSRHLNRSKLARGAE